MTWAELDRLARSRLATGHGFARRVHADVFSHGRFHPDGLPASSAHRAAWAAGFALTLAEVVHLTEEHGPLGVTAKAVLRRRDGLETECVWLPMGRGRSTLCISSQVGCKMRCGFCETGRMGLLSHMTAAEIVGQLLVARHRLGWNFRNVVFMGMGEALDNAPAVLQAIRVITDPAGLCMSQERVTVCTVGHIPGLQALAVAGFRRLNLSVSLNAADDSLRDRLMPINRRYPLAQLQAALAAYRPRRNFALGVNYCLMPGINDDRQQVEKIARFCAPLGRVMLNLIPYNPGRAPITRAPTDLEIGRFTEWLRAAGLRVRRRVTKGRGVMAACGQLGNVAQRDLHRR